MCLSAGTPFTLGASETTDSGRTISGNRATREVQMLDKQTRAAILVLRMKGQSLHRISQLLSLSRTTVRKVIKIGSDEPPIIHRPSKLYAHRERIAEMLADFGGSVETKPFCISKKEVWERPA